MPRYDDWDDLPEYRPASDPLSSLINAEIAQKTRDRRVIDAVLDGSYWAGRDSARKVWEIIKAGLKPTQDAQTRDSVRKEGLGKSDKEGSQGDGFRE